MKNIKVNIINIDGKRSSTTLNYTICKWLYIRNATDEESLALLDYDIKEIRMVVSQKAQSFTNDLVSKMEHYATSGITQEQIENQMMISLLHS